MATEHSSSLPLPQQGPGRTFGPPTTHFPLGQVRSMGQLWLSGQWAHSMAGVGVLWGHHPSLCAHARRGGCHMCLQVSFGRSPNGRHPSYSAPTASGQGRDRDKSSSLEALLVCVGGARGDPKVCAWWG